MPAHTNRIAFGLLLWCSIVALLFGCAAASEADGKDKDGFKISDQLSSFADAAQSAYTAALAEAGNQYSKAMSAASVRISGEPEPVQSAAFASVSSAYFDAIAAAQRVIQKAQTNIIPEATPTPTAGYFDWEKVQSLAQKNLDDSVKWAGGQYEQAKSLLGAADATPTTSTNQNLLEEAKLKYYAGLGVAHDRYHEFLSSASAVAGSWAAATATPTATSNLADKAGENWDWLIAQVSEKVYGAPTPTPAWYAHYYTQATQAPIAVSSIVSELLVGKEPSYQESVLSQLAAAYSQATATVSSVYTEATQAIDDALEDTVEALGNAGKFAYEQVSGWGDKVSDTIGERKKKVVKDEL